MRQAVVYRKKTGSSSVDQYNFELAETRRRYCVLRLWEEALALFCPLP